jgi:hypothetical protein
MMPRAISRYLFFVVLILVAFLAFLSMTNYKPANNQTDDVINSANRRGKWRTFPLTANVGIDMVMHL